MTKWVWKQWYLLMEKAPEVVGLIMVLTIVVVVFIFIMILREFMVFLNWIINKWSAA